MSGSYSSRLRAGSGGVGGGGLGATTVLAAKVAFASAALAAAASLARVAVPHLLSGSDAFVWKLCLFVTVHVIIFVIWKLSDNKHFHAQQYKDPWAPTPHHPAPPLLTEDVVLPAMKRKVEFAPPAATAEVYRVPLPVSRPHLEADAASPVYEGVVSPGSCGGESCVTTESEEDVSSSAINASANVATADTWRSVESAPAPARKRAVIEPAPPPSRERAVVEPAPAQVRKRAVVEPAPVPACERAVAKRGVSLPPPAAIIATDEHFDGADHVDANSDDDLDATWNAIMQKTRPATAPALSSSSPRAPRVSPPRPAPSPRPRAREPSVGAAELSKRSEDFIKKIHHSFGRHQ